MFNGFKSLSVPILIGGLFFLASCDRAFQDRNYDLMEVGGETYLLDRDSGSVYLKQDGDLIALVAKDPPDPGVLSQVQSFGPVSLPPVAGGSVTIDGRYKYVNGTLRYVLNVGVSLGEDANAGSGKDFLATNYESIAVNFLDQDGFEVIAEQIDLQGGWKSASGAAGAAGDTPSFSFDGRVPLDPEEFTMISEASISWREAEPVREPKPVRESEPVPSNER